MARDTSALDGSRGSPCRVCTPAWPRPSACPYAVAAERVRGRESRPSSQGTFYPVSLAPFPHGAALHARPARDSPGPSEGLSPGRCTFQMAGPAWLLGSAPGRAPHATSEPLLWHCTLSQKCDSPAGGLCTDPVPGIYLRRIERHLSKTDPTEVATIRPPSTTLFHNYITSLKVKRVSTNCLSSLCEHSHNQTKKFT